jgi:hypothetical protein
VGESEDRDIRISQLRVRAKTHIVRRMVIAEMRINGGAKRSEQKGVFAKIGGRCGPTQERPEAIEIG